MVQYICMAAEKKLRWNCSGTESARSTLELIFFLLLNQKNSFLWKYGIIFAPIKV